MSRTLWRALSVLFFAQSFGGVPARASPRAPKQGYVVHEWGTFTAVAGPDGQAVEWRPLSGPSDLPDFVYTIDKSGGYRTLDNRYKGRPGTVRMETPVLYFHTNEVVEVNVRVDFPEGQVTEWYPRAADRGRGISWDTVRVDPFAQPTLPHDGSDSHYYPARAVDSAPVRVCDPVGNEWEQLLFYRGVGTFMLSLTARLDDRHIDLSGAAMGRVIVYERDGDRVGVSAHDRIGMVVRPELDDTVHDAHVVVRQELLDSGLFADEADAMLATWDDDWFEPGLRVIWVVPRDETDSRLPLHLDPAPVSSVRTLVGRLELVTPERADAMQATLRAHPSPTQAAATLQEAGGRFAEPVLVHLVSRLPDGPDRDHAKAVLSLLRTPARS